MMGLLKPNIHLENNIYYRYFLNIYYRRIQYIE